MGVLYKHPTCFSLWWLPDAASAPPGVIGSMLTTHAPRPWGSLPGLLFARLISGGLLRRKDNHAVTPCQVPFLFYVLLLCKTRIPGHHAR